MQRHLIFLALAGLASVAAAQPAPAARGKAAVCNPDEPSFWRDQGLATKVAAKLQFHKPLLREKVDVKVSGGAVILSGNLSSQKLIDEATRTAAQVGGVKCVQSYLKIGPPTAPTANN